MKINIISILIVVLLTYALTLNILIASQAGIVLVVILGLVDCYQKFFMRKDKRREPKKARVERNIVTALLVLLLLSFGLYYTPFMKYYHAMYQMNSAYETMPTKPIINAIQDIKKNPNDMKYCALLLLPSLKNNSPKALAQYLALYYAGKKYCNQYGPWFENNCSYLKSMDYSGYPIVLRKNIRLCEIANSQAFQERLKRGGYQDDQ
ncbi:MAG: hypothetical protein KDH94_00170 [Coxiellaceae bacterium]|nr:hypothetical protein [Coxiellaceae bacterium]